MYTITYSAIVRKVVMQWIRVYQLSPEQICTCRWVWGSQNEEQGRPLPQNRCVACL